MAKVHRLPNLRTTEREASAWIALLHADDVSSDDRARFEAWRKAHPAHSRAYESLLPIWQECVARREIASEPALEPPIHQPIHEPMHAPRRRWRWALAAAALAAVVSLTLLAYLPRHARQRPILQTAIGERASVSLADGSSLDLNSNSIARIEFSESARVVRLERGEAFLRVKHDTRRPFWVLAGHSWVRAVGTAFDVRLRAADVRVTVSEGTVKVAAAGPWINGEPSDAALAMAPVSVLTAGHQADVRASGAVIRSLAAQKISRSASWRHGTVYFENQPLSDVVDELARYTTLQLIVTDHTIGRLRIGGTFQASPQGVETLLSRLKIGFGLDIRRDRDRVYIDRAAGSGSATH